MAALMAVVRRIGPGADGFYTAEVIDGKGRSGSVKETLKSGDIIVIDRIEKMGIFSKKLMEK
jgi:hypothetical protein